MTSEVAETPAAQPDLATANTNATSSDEEDAGVAAFTPTDASDPIQLYTERLRSWKALAKLLIAYFEEVRQQEAQSAKGYARAAAVVRPPWRHSNAFRPPVTAEAAATVNRATANGGAAPAPVAAEPAAEDGDAVDTVPTAISDLIHALHTSAKEMSEQQERSARAIHDQTIRELTRLRLECKRRSREVNKELLGVKQKATKANDKAKTRLVQLERACDDLQTSLASRRLNQEEKTLPTDPWLTKLEVQYCLSKQFAKENRYQQALVSFQQSLAAFETSAVQTITAAVNTYNDWRLKDLHAQITRLKQVHSVTERQDRDKEHSHFIERHAGHLPTANTPLRSLATATFPRMDDPGAIAARIGRIEKKGGLLNQWREYRAVLSAAGYVHIFPVSSGLGADAQTDFTQQPTPELSIYLPHCTIGAHSLEGAAENSFELTERVVDGGGLFRKSQHRYQIRVATRDDMLAWWEAMGQHARATLTQSVAAAPEPVGVASTSGTERQTVTSTGSTSKRSSMFSRFSGSFSRTKGASAAAAVAETSVAVTAEEASKPSSIAAETPAEPAVETKTATAGEESPSPAAE
ncbi:hypothetical protein THASP1DRAFT_24625 [Thamnocephalis sphaerospora]|uniref:PH domain-containing protein n=1 Tax=Thamnocephalis sphaerospora TaxID=78915 RepID=A0A4P9XMN7_9FUNG|nr:hypothetical protein THASP1DRAFT_24625 [Thamnocephalis sphaerospora]|eukprot:RKP07178.1 hypothetical protein THASP1DRAFT_24625 [Thamnocephalis sphaerospora]